GYDVWHDAFDPLELEKAVLLRRSGLLRLGLGCRHRCRDAKSAAQSRAAGDANFRFSVGLIGHPSELAALGWALVTLLLGIRGNAARCFAVLAGDVVAHVLWVTPPQIELDRHFVEAQLVAKLA